MIINDLDLAGVGFVPDKAYSHLVINADTVTVFPVAFELFQPVGRRNPQVFPLLGPLDHVQFPECYFLY